MSGDLSQQKPIYSTIFGQAIRLLTLLPGNTSEIIRCDLCVSALDPTPSYEAISYVWGDASKVVLIELNGHPFSVRLNLAHCLRRLRLAHTTRTLWVDALCIDQTDVEDKSRQVSLMSRIYHRSQCTFIWLGEHEQLSPWRTVMPMCQSSAAAPYAPPSTCCGRYSSEQIPATIAPTEIFSLLEDLASNRHLVYSAMNFAKAVGLFHITRLPWWHRVWVVQETLLSVFPVLMLGGAFFPWEVAFSGSKNFVKHLTTCCRPEFIAGDCYKCVGLYHRHMAQVCLTILSFQSIALDHTNDFLSYLWMIRDKDATEPSDKIYAILGLLKSDASTELKPNYSIDFRTLCVSVVLDNIKVTGTLDVLKGGRPEYATSPELPSWATDWSYKMHNSEERSRILSELSGQVYSASKNHCPHWFLSSTNVLGISGIVFDVVHEIGSVGVGGYNGGQRITQMETLNQWMEQVKILQTKHDKYVQGGTYFTAFWRTLLADSVLPDQQRLDPHRISADWRVSTKSTYSLLRRTRPTDAIIWSLWWLWRNDKIRPGVMIQAVRDIGSSVTRATAERRFFVTSKGYLGLGPENTRVGDEISLLLGGSTPFLLRRSAPLNYQYRSELHYSRYEGTYMLLGDCYVHGCMDGELLDKADIVSNMKYLFLE